MFAALKFLIRSIRDSEWPLGVWGDLARVVSISTLFRNRQRLVKAGWMNSNVFSRVFGRIMSQTGEQLESTGRKSAKHVLPSANRAAN